MPHRLVAESHRLPLGVNRLGRASGMRRTSQAPSLAAQTAGVASWGTTKTALSTCADCDTTAAHGDLSSLQSGGLAGRSTRSVRRLGCAELRCTQEATFNQPNGPRRGTSCAASPPASSPRPASSSSQCLSQRTPCSRQGVSRTRHRKAPRRSPQR